MRKFTIRAFIYLILAIIGLILVIYSFKADNYILMVVAVLFTVVSTYNIFCGFRKITI